MYDLHVARRLTHEEAKSLLTKVLNVPQPVVIDSIDEHVPDDVPLWCVLPPVLPIAGIRVIPCASAA